MLSAGVGIAVEPDVEAPRGSEGEFAAFGVGYERGLGLCRDDGEDAVEGFERGADAFILSIHFILRNPVLWAGSELSGFASKKLMGYPFAELFPQLSRKDQSHEPVSKVITSALVL